jgi:hypothetical protein
LILPFRGKGLWALPRIRLLGRVKVRLLSVAPM